MTALEHETDPLADYHPDGPATADPDADLVADLVADPDAGADVPWAHEQGAVEASGEEQDVHPAVARATEAAVREPRFKFYSRDDLRHLPPPSWIIDGLLMDNGLVTLFGPSGIGKSFTAIDMACAISAGTASFGHKVLRQGPVVIIAGEGVSGLNQRINAYELRNPDADTSQLFILPVAVNLLDECPPHGPQYPTELDDLIDLLAAMETPPVLVVIDTLARAMIGDENNAHDMGLLIRAQDRIRLATGASVMFVHHTLKPQPGKLVTERGSGALRGAQDQMLSVSEGDLGTLVLASSKLKDGKPFSDKHMLLTPVGASCVLEPANTPTATPTATAPASFSQGPGVPNGQGTGPSPVYPTTHGGGFGGTAASAQPRPMRTGDLF